MHMITGLKQLIWRNRRWIVLAPESDSAHVVVFEETLRGPILRDSHRFDLDSDADSGAGNEDATDWERFVGRHKDESWIILLPHQATISQWMSLKVSESDQLEDRLQEQTERLVGLGESQIVIDYEEIPSRQPDISAYWITYCQETEIRKIIRDFGLFDVAICDVIGSMDAFFASIRTDGCQQGEWMLVEVCEGGTAVAFFDGHYPHYTSFFPVGDGMAREQGWRASGPIRIGPGSSVGSEVALQRTINGIPKIAAEWGRDIQRAWQEYRVSLRKENQVRSIDCPVMLIASPEVQDAWAEAARSVLGLEPLQASKVWGDSMPNLTSRERKHWGGFQAVHHRAMDVPSLLPEAVKCSWNEKQINLVLRSLAFLSCVLAIVVMGVAVVQKAMLWRAKAELIEAVDAIEGRFDQSLLVLQGLKEEYKMLCPIIEAEQHTLATLDVLGAMQEIRTNYQGWMVLLADKQSYYMGDETARTNPVSSTNTFAPVPTNQIPFKRGFIVETVLNSSGEAMRNELEEIVGFLKSREYLQNADILPGDTRRMLVDSNLVVAGKHFAFSLELPVSDDEGLSTESVSNPRATDRSIVPVWRKLQPEVGSAGEKMETSQP